MRQFTFLLLFLVGYAFNAEAYDLYLLKNNTINIAPYEKQSEREIQLNIPPVKYGPIVYSSQVLKKGKFENLYIHPNQEIYGLPLFIKDVTILKDGKKNTSYAILAQRQNEEIVIKVPLKFEWSERPPCVLWYEKTKAADDGMYETKLEYINIPFYDNNLIDSITNAYEGKNLYPIKIAYEGNLTNQFGFIREDLRYDYHNMKNHLILGKPYVFKGFAYKNPMHEKISTLHALFEDATGLEIKVPIKHSCDSTPDNHKSYLPSLECFGDYFMKEEVLADISLNNNNVVDSISSLKGKEIYLETNSFTGYGIDELGKLEERKYGLKSGFYTVEDVCYITSKDQIYPFIDFFVLLTSSKDNYTCAFIINKESIKSIKDGEIMHIEILRKEEEKKKKMEEQTLLQEEDELERRARLIKKYGEGKAELILKGIVMVGDTKEICEEILSHSIGIYIPFKSAIEYSKEGHTEVWSFKGGKRWYFRGNKVCCMKD